MTSTATTTPDDRAGTGVLPSFPIPRHQDAHPDGALDPTAAFGRQAARLLADNRRRTSLFVGLEHLFGDPAWTMLLFLYEMFAARKAVTTTDVSNASGAPTTTALRYITALERAGLVERTADRQDRRRSFVTLSRQGRAWMERYLEKVAA